MNYVSGFYGWAGITTITCNIIIPQIFWFRRMRRSIPAMIFVALAVTLGMWMERFVIIVISLHQDYLPSSWHKYVPDQDRLRHSARIVRLVLHAGAALRPRLAGHRDQRDEGQPARRQANGGAAMSKRQPSPCWGSYSDAQKIVDAANQIRPRKLGRLEAYTPYPVHGLDRAIGLAPSRLGRLVMFMGVIGACLALLFEWWTSAVDYPLVTGGKALFSWQAFVPVMFEVTVLFATFTAGLAMLFAFNKLPFFGHPVLHSKAIKGITRDKLALSIEAAGAAFDAEAARQALHRQWRRVSRDRAGSRVGSPAQLGRASAHHRGHRRGLRGRGRGPLRRRETDPHRATHDPHAQSAQAECVSLKHVLRRRARHAARGCGNSGTRSFAAGFATPEEAGNLARAIRCRSPNPLPSAGARSLTTTARFATALWATACPCFRAPMAASPAISCPTKYALAPTDTTLACSCWARTPCPATPRILDHDRSLGGRALHSDSATGAERQGRGSAMSALLDLRWCAIFWSQ